MWVEKEVMVVTNKTKLPMIYGCPYINPEIPDK